VLGIMAAILGSQLMQTARRSIRLTLGKSANGQADSGECSEGGGYLGTAVVALREAPDLPVQKFVRFGVLLRRHRPHPSSRGDLVGARSFVAFRRVGHLA
jgi:hypothetical protein